MKRVLIFLFCIILLVGTISAFEFDNVKKYNPEEKEVTIINSFGYGDDIAKIKLNTPLVYRVAPGYRMVAEFEVVNFKDYPKALKELKFYDVNKGYEQFERKFDYKYKIIEKKGLGTKISWKDLDGIDLKEGDKLTIGIFTNVETGDYVEWIPTFFGVEIDEWAFWQSSMNIGIMAYYTFDNTTATQTTLVDYYHRQNGTLIGMEAEDWVTGKIGNALDFDGAAEFVDLGNFGYKPVNYTLSMWIMPDDHAGVQSPVRSSDAGGDNTAWGINLRDAGDNIEVIVSTGAASQVGVVGNTWKNDSFPDNSWTHLIVMVNGTHLSYYTNGSISGRIAQTQVPAGVSKKTSIARAGEVNSLYYDGKIDELGIWNRSLSDEEISSLWNNGNGIQPSDKAMIITLNSPENNLKTINQEILFNFTVDSGTEVETLGFWLDGELNYTFSNYTYQENANVTNCLGDWDPMHPCSYTYDGNWNTYGQIEDYNKDAYVYFNYTKQGGMTSNSLWQVKDDGGMVNLSIPVNCWNQYSDKIGFRVHSHAGGIGDDFNVTWACRYDDPAPSEWTILRTNNGVNLIDQVNYEEAIWWKKNRTYIEEVWTMNLPYKNYIWEIVACDGVLCVNSSIYSFEIFEYVAEQSHSYNSSTYETSSETFVVNFTYDSSKWNAISSVLNYDGTEYSGTRSGGGDDLLFSRTIDLPSITSQENKTFYWNYSLSNSTGNFYYGGEENKQTVNPMILTICNTTYDVPYLRFTFKDEGDSSEMNASNDLSDFNYWLGSGTTTKSYITSNATENLNYSFCFDPNTTSITTDLTFKYSSSGYPIRTFSYDDKVLTNSTTEQVLYLLSTSDGIYSSIQVIETSGAPIEGVEVIAEREIAGSWVIIGQGITGADGLVTFWVNPNFQHKITVTKTGYTSGTVTITPSQSTYTLTLRKSSGDVEFDSSLEGMSWKVSPASGYLIAGSHTFTFNLTASLSNLDSCKFELVNLDSSAIVNSVTGGDSTGCNLSMDYTLSTGEWVYGNLYVDTTDTPGYILIDSDLRWGDIEGSDVSTWQTIFSFFSELKDLEEWGTCETSETCHRAEFSRIVGFFLILSIIIGIFSYFTQMDTDYPGAACILIFILITLASFAGWFTLGLGSTTSTFIQKYTLTLVCFFFTTGWILNFMARNT